MFQKILTWIRGVINKMIGKSDIRQALAVDVAVSVPMAEALQLWGLLYENRAPWLSQDVHSLNLPAAIAGEIARAVTIEMKVEISGSARAAFLQKQVNRLLLQLRQMVEFGCAKGGIIIKPYVVDGQIVADFVQADCFYPVSFDGNGNITAAVFADQKTIGDSFYTRMELHQMTPAGCLIRSQAFRSSSRETLGQPVPLAAVMDWADLEPEAVITGIDRPLFAYFKYPQANNIDPASPLGVSCFSRAIDLIEQADRQWSNLLWEFESGQRALFVDVSAFTVDPKTGLPILPSKRLYRTLNQMNTAEIGAEGFFEEWTPTLRQSEIIEGLDAMLKKIEFACGLEYGSLSDPMVQAKTATEIKASKQRTYATITDTQKALQAALEQLLWAMDVWATLERLAPRGPFEAAYTFDDSVVTDHDIQFAQDLQLVSAGIMPKWEFRVRNFGETEEIAKTKIAAIQDEQGTETSFFQNEGV